MPVAVRTAFSANLNKVALVRNSRGHGKPDLAAVAELCVRAGAHGITVHPRPDGRHTRADDLLPLRQLTRRLGVEFNIEGYPDERFLHQVLAVAPDQVTLVPDAPGQLTSDHGWDVLTRRGEVAPAVRRLTDAGLRVSLFVDADPQQAVAAAGTGAQRIELYTQPWADAHGTPQQASALAAFRATAEAAQRAGLAVNAGHDLSLANLGELLDGVPGIKEVSIGHALISDAFLMGMPEAVRRYVAICNGSR